MATKKKSKPKTKGKPKKGMEATPMGGGVPGPMVPDYPPAGYQGPPNSPMDHGGMPNPAETI